MLMRSKFAALAAVMLTGASLVVAQDREVRQAERAADRAAAAQDRAQDRAEDARDNAPKPNTRPAAPAREEAPRGEAPARQAAPAQDQQAAEPAERRPAQTYRAKQVLGARLSITGNISIGTVDDIVFADDGYIEYLIVQNEGKMVTVPWEAAKFDFEKRSATINITQEQFRQVPTYTQAQYPTYSAPTYRTQIYQAYGMTAGQERRLERRLGR